MFANYSAPLKNNNYNSLDAKEQADRDNSSRIQEKDTELRDFQDDFISRAQAMPSFHPVRGSVKTPQRPMGRLFSILNNVRARETQENNDGQAQDVKFLQVQSESQNPNFKSGQSSVQIKPMEDNEHMEDNNNHVHYSNEEENNQNEVSPQTKAYLQRKSTMNQDKNKKHQMTMFFASDYEITSTNTKRRVKKKCVIYPEDMFKARWDLIQTFILMFTCCETPYVIAFLSDNMPVGVYVTEMLIDILFATDLVICFFTATYSTEFILIDDKKLIAKNYLTSWFCIDAFSILPLETIVQTTSFNRLVRIARVGKLYKVIKMARLFRMLKVVKEKNRLAEYLEQILKIGVGFERLLFLLMIFMILLHIATCIWVFVGNFDDSSKKSWIYESGFCNEDDYNLYVISLYYTVTTIMTVGYGDITPTNLGERLISIVLMIIGIVSFSFASGSLSSIMSNYDSSQAKLKEKLGVLNQIRSQYDVCPDLIDELRQSIKYDSRKSQEEIYQFMEDLPYKLKTELAVEIHKDLRQDIPFFRHRDKSFIAWVGPYLKHHMVSEEEYIYKEGDDINEIYFLKNGIAGFVLPRFDNTSYIQIEKGDHFGIIDLVFDQSLIPKDKLNMSQQWKIEGKKEQTRLFTVRAFEDCELILIRITDIFKMKVEFPDEFDELLDNSVKLLKKSLMLKVEAIKLCEQSNGVNNARSSSAFVLLNQLKSQKMLSGSKVLNKQKTTGEMMKEINKSLKKIQISQNHTSLKQIDEELEISESDSSHDHDDTNKEGGRSHTQSCKKQKVEEERKEEEKFLSKFKLNFGNFIQTAYHVKRPSQTSDSVLIRDGSLRESPSLTPTRVDSAEPTSADIRRLNDRVTNVEYQLDRMNMSLEEINSKLMLLIDRK